MGAKTKVIITERRKNEERKNAAAENAVVITAVITKSERRYLDGSHPPHFRETTALEGWIPVSDKGYT